MNEVLTLFGQLDTLHVVALVIILILMRGTIMAWVGRMTGRKVTATLPTPIKEFVDRLTEHEKQCAKFNATVLGRFDLLEHRMDTMEETMKATNEEIKELRSLIIGMNQ